MICEVCGCTDHSACLDVESGECCTWIAEGLCSFCEFAPLGWRAPYPYQRLPLYPLVELPGAPSLKEAAAAELMALMSAAS